MGEINHKVIEQTFGEFAKDIIGDLEVIADKIGRHGLNRDNLVSICLDGKGYMTVSAHQYSGVSAYKTEKGGSLNLNIETRTTLIPAEPKGEKDADI